MSLTNPVISDLIVATYDQDRHAEVEKVRTRRDAPLGLTRMARGVDLGGALAVVRVGGTRSRPEVATAPDGRVLAPAGSGSDGRLR